MTRSGCKVLAVVGAGLLPLAASAGVTGSLQGGGGYDEFQNDHEVTWALRGQLGLRSEGGHALLGTVRLMGLGDGARTLTLTGEVRLGGEAAILQPFIAAHAGVGSVSGCEERSANPCDGSGPVVGAELGLRWLTGVRVQPHASVEYLHLRGVGSVPDPHASAFNVLVGVSF